MMKIDINANRFDAETGDLLVMVNGDDVHVYKLIVEARDGYCLMDIDDCWLRSCRFTNITDLIEHYGANPFSIVDIIKSSELKLVRA